MGLIPDKEIEAVRGRADIVALIGERLPLKRAGRNFKACCPFHAEKTPSFMVNPEKQIYHCFGCGEGGDIFRFLMKQEGLSFGEAVERLAERVGVVLSGERENADEFRKKRSEKEEAGRINRLVARFFHHHLKGEKGEKAREYLREREIDLKTADEVFLGYAPAGGEDLVGYLRSQRIPLEGAERLGLVRRNERGWFDFFRDRLLFPIVSLEGKVLGFSGRTLAQGTEGEGGPKYLNSPDSVLYNKSESLLGFPWARDAIREEKKVILVEGNVDWLRLFQGGIKNVVAPLGTALTERQIRLLKRWTENFVLLFDGDEAGWRAALRALDLFLPLGVIPGVVLLPPGEDPDSFVRKKGVEAIQERVKNPPPLLDVVLDRHRSEGAKGAEKMMALIDKLPGDIEKTKYIQVVADRFGFPESTLWKSISASNFSKRGADASPKEPSSGKKEETGPSIEKALVEILFSGQVDPAPLLREIRGEEFSHPALREVWEVCRKEFEEKGSLEVAALLGRVEEEALREKISRLAVSASVWSDSGAKVATDCLQRFRVVRMKGKLKGLSDEIRSAEVRHDFSLLQTLVEEKNRLLREMKSLH